MTRQELKRWEHDIRSLNRTDVLRFAVLIQQEKRDRQKEIRPCKDGTGADGNRGAVFIISNMTEIFN